MKHLLTIILILPVLYISCKGNGSETNSNNIDSINVEDSVIETTETTEYTPIVFIKQLGVDYEPYILRGDSLPSPSAEGFLLNTKEQYSLLNGVISYDFNLSSSASVSLLSVRLINDDMVFCQYKYSHGGMDEIYFAIYNVEGTLVDAMFAGNYWEEEESVGKLSDSTQLITKEHTLMHFNDSDNFVLVKEYKEWERNVDSFKDSTTFSTTIRIPYNIDAEGKINIAEINVSENGTFRAFAGPKGHWEWNLFEEMHVLRSYPFSDDSVLEKWDDIGKKVDGIMAEGFDLNVFEYVFLPRPEKVLKWIYDNRDTKSDRLLSSLNFYYTEVDESRKDIEGAIAKLDNPVIRAYFEALTESWKENNTY